MPVRKLRELDSTTVGVSLPLDELRFDGLVDEDGEIVGDEQRGLIRRKEAGRYEVVFVGEDD
jgi:hypothetical protein